MRMLMKGGWRKSFIFGPIMPILFLETISIATIYKWLQYFIIFRKVTEYLRKEWIRGGESGSEVAFAFPLKKSKLVDGDEDEVFCVEVENKAVPFISITQQKYTLWIRTPPSKFPIHPISLNSDL